MTGMRVMTVLHVMTSLHVRTGLHGVDGMDVVIGMNVALVMAGLHVVPRVHAMAGIADLLVVIAVLAMAGLHVPGSIHIIPGVRTMTGLRIVADEFAMARVRCTIGLRVTREACIRRDAPTVRARSAVAAVIRGDELRRAQLIVGVRARSRFGDYPTRSILGMIGRTVAISVRHNMFGVGGRRLALSATRAESTVGSALDSRRACFGMRAMGIPTSGNTPAGECDLCAVTRVIDKVGGLRTNCSRVRVVRGRCHRRGGGSATCGVSCHGVIGG
ncbi:hypothetical protein [Nocardia colli]|uniref:hypothetical protein n=1 Tax=Nocardia colli TaxID=2545717 RepID=UPI001CC44F62|nr:hypothetical protein [Nocardia colli]